MKTKKMSVKILKTSMTSLNLIMHILIQFWINSIFKFCYYFYTYKLENGFFLYLVFTLSNKVYIMHKFSVLLNYI